MPNFMSPEHTASASPSPPSVAGDDQLRVGTVQDDRAARHAEAPQAVVLDRVAADAHVAQDGAILHGDGAAEGAAVRGASAARREAIRDVDLVAAGAAEIHEPAADLHHGV